MEHLIESIQCETLRHRIFFQISHSEDLIALAFSDTDCGVDIEKIKPRDYKKVSSRMKFECETLEDFYFEWTKFEAKYKLGKDKQNFGNCIFYLTYI